MDQSDRPRPDLAGDLARIHQAITRGLKVSLDRSLAFGRDGFPNDETKQGFVLYLQALTGTLHGHHVAEDKVAWPNLRKKLPDAPYETLIADHQKMETELQGMQAATGRLASGEGAEALGALQETLQRIHALWAPHIKVEEQYFSREALDGAMDLAEEGMLAMQLARHGQEHSAPGPLGVPFVLYNLAPEQRARMAAVMPPEVTQELLPGPWKATWGPMAPFLLD